MNKFKYLKNIIMLILYAIPWYFISMYIAWIFNMISPGLLCWLPPIILGGVCGINKRKKIFLIGSISTLITSMCFTLLLNSMNPTNDFGYGWQGAFKPFYSEQMVVFIFITIFILQLMAYVCVRDSDFAERIRSKNNQ